MRSRSTEVSSPPVVVTRRRAVVLSVLALTCRGSLADGPLRSSDAELTRVLRSEGLPGTDPIIADTGNDGSNAPYRAALVQATSNAMRLVIVRHAGPGRFVFVARSAPIGGLRGANYGFGVEAFRFGAPDRLELALSARSACDRVLYTHRFALRRDDWLVTRLDTDMPRCAERGAVQSWTESANYLSGTSRRTEFSRSGAPRTTVASASRQPFPLAQFPPDGPETPYRDMQP